MSAFSFSSPCPIIPRPFFLLFFLFYTNQERLFSAGLSAKKCQVEVQKIVQMMVDMQVLRGFSMLLTQMAQSVRHSLTRFVFVPSFFLSLYIFPFSLILVATAKEGWVIFVTGVHEEASEDDVLDKFNDFGKVRNINLNLDRQTGFAKGYALIEYSLQSEAEAAIQGMNGQALLGKEVRVTYTFVGSGGNATSERERDGSGGGGGKGGGRSEGGDRRRGGVKGY